MKAPQFQAQAALEESHWWHRGKKRILTGLIQRLVPPSRENLVVDVGCGTGANAAALAEDYRVIGIDESEEALRPARERYPRVTFLRGEAPEDLGGAAREARAFLMSDVLEHVRDDAGWLARLARAASPGAYFLLTVPADMSLWSAHDVSLGHHRRYDAASFQNLWSGLPFSTLLVSHYNARLYPAVKLVRAFNRRRGAAAGRAGTDVGPVPKFLNRPLEEIFAGEEKRLAAALSGRAPAYARGVSLLAVLRKNNER
ncbi:MAG: class I SAM-dependent methyltransferase [Elusimicrobiota bacterium]